MHTSFLTEIISNEQFLKKFPNLKKLMNVEFITELMQNIKSEYLYKSKFHGLYHSEKVAFFAYLIGRYYNLDTEDMQIILDAALYHDIGRTSDFEDTTHGLTSTFKMDFLKTNPLYNNPVNLELVKAITDGHSLDDKLKQVVFDNHELPEREYERFNILYNILKDADALDRMRFDKTMKSTLNERFLRLPISKKLSSLAEYVNKEYRRLIDITNYDFIKSQLINQEPQTFYHGIGFNFFAIPSILEKGITSVRYDENNPKHIRNFAGYNNNMWISAVDASNPKEGYEQFIAHGIYFEFTSSDYHRGLENKIEALDTGMPYRSNLYQDETFIFERIAPEQIISLSLQEEVYNCPLQKISLIKGNISYERILERINYYCQFLNPKKIKQYQQFFEPYLKDLKENTLQFEMLNNFEQQQNYKEFLASQDAIVSSINNLLVLLYLNYYKEILHKKDITVKDLLIYILNKSHINYELNNIEGQIKITFPNLQLTR